MKNILKLTLVLTLLFNSGFIFSQAQNMGYTILSENVTFVDQEMELSSTITKTGDSLVWTQIKSGFSETSYFTITNSSGGWDQSTSQGLATYNMVTEGYQCEFILSGQENDLSATLIYRLNGNEEERYVFDINAIIYQ